MEAEPTRATGKPGAKTSRSSTRLTSTGSPSYNLYALATVSGNAGWVILQNTTAV
jgi:hypothetical protein